MKTPLESRHELFKRLYFTERSRREAVRGSIGTPVASISFTVFALGSLSAAFDVSRWSEPLGLAIAGLACASTVSLFAAAYQVVMVEWLFIYHEPPGLSELVAAETATRAARPADAVPTEMLKLLTATYYIAYEQYLCGNTMSTRHRAWALRLVLLSLLFLALAFLLLPAYRATG